MQGCLRLGIYRLAPVLLLSILLCGCNERLLYKDNRILMGTFTEVISPNRKAAEIVFDEIRRIENLLSKYSPGSEVSRLNKSGRLNVSPDTFYIIKTAKEFWRMSDGAFDITVAPLMDLWGFTDKKYTLPENARINATLKLVGSENINLYDAERLVEFSVPGMKIDLGGIAKGYAVDCAVNKLREAGIKSCLINAGGQIYCLGDNFGRLWKVAIKKPRDSGFIGLLKLKDRAIATSGDYEQYFIIDKKRYSHILNPKTGYPADSGLVSVTVVAPDSLTADTLSTAIFVLGKKKSQFLIRNLPGIMVKFTEEK